MALLGVGLVAWWAQQSPSLPLEQEPMETVLPLPAAWIGDLDGMRERRLVRILVPYSKTLYFLDRGQQRGVVYDAGMELKKWLNRKYGSRTLPFRVAFIPTSREKLLQKLADGLGDIVAANLTITPERQKLVDFTVPYAKPVAEIVVTGPNAPTLKTLKDLSSVPIHIRTSSSYFEHLQRLAAEQNLDLDIVPVDEALEDEDLLEMVNAGLLPLAVIDSHKAKFWAQIFDKITLREDLAINEGGRIAWALRKNSPLLLAELNEFRKVEVDRKGLGNMLLKRYLVSTRYISQATDDKGLSRFNELQGLFRKYAEMYKLNDLLLMAQAYQESRLDQSARSHAGAVGIMQLLPSTAASSAVQIVDIENTEQNIHAGAKYLRHLLDTYLSDPELDSTNRLLLGLAAYNAGPGNLKKMRRKAAAMGLNKNIWFNNVEYAAAELIGRESVQYVSNIYKYYLAYRLVEEQRRVKSQLVPLG